MRQFPIHLYQQLVMSILQSMIKRKLIKFTLIAGFFFAFLAALSVDGQTLPHNVSLTSGGFPTASGTKAGTPPSNQSPAGTELTVNVNLGDVSPTSLNHLVICRVPVRISADGNYKIEIKRMAKSETGGPQPKDIGFGIGNFRAQMPGSNQLAGTALSVSVDNNFANDPTKFKKIQGVPEFITTLDNVPANLGTVLFTGSATTSAENVGSDKGSILADLTFVVVPQYFDPSNDTSLILTLSITPVD